MPFGKRPTLTGPDYLLGMGEQLARDGAPFAAEFRDMVMDAIRPDVFGGTFGATLAEVAATRPLREHEAGPVAVIIAAAEMAARHKDRQSVDEIIRVGAALLAKWPDWLLSRNDGHPELRWKDTD
jgi:hypothetical protein